MADTFRNRQEAGEALASRLQAYRGGDALVLGMARGGVVVARSVASALSLPLAALVVRKLGAPRNPELAIGAVSETGERWIDQHMVEVTGASQEYVESEVAAQVAEARRRQAAYSVGDGPAAAHGRTVILVDDGIATGASAVVAVRSTRDLGATAVVLATPAASMGAIDVLRPQVDDLIALITPEPFLAVGLYYANFAQVDDAEVIAALSDALKR